MWPPIKTSGKAWKNSRRLTPNCFAETILLKLSSADFNQLSQFVSYANKRFDLSLLAGTFGDGRPQPEIPSRPVWMSVILDFEPMRQGEEQCAAALRLLRRLRKEVWATLL